MELETAIEMINKTKSANAKEIVDIFNLNKTKFQTTLNKVESSSVDNIVWAILNEHYKGVFDGDTIATISDGVRDKHPDLAVKLSKNYIIYNRMIGRLNKTNISEEETLQGYLDLHKAYNACLDAIDEAYGLAEKRVDDKDYKYDMKYHR